MWNEQEEEDAARFADWLRGSFFDLIKIGIVFYLVYFIWSCGN